MSNKSETPADLPDQCVRPLRSADAERLREQSAAKGRRFVRLDLSNARDRKSVFREIGRALEFPDWFGANLDALYDVLADPDPDAPGLVIVIDRWPAAGVLDVGARKELLDVFRDVAALREERGLPFQVFYR
jgi:Barstar (barnase inhibitor)